MLSVFDAQNTFLAVLLAPHPPHHARSTVYGSTLMRVSRQTHYTAVSEGLINVMIMAFDA